VTARAAPAQAGLAGCPGTQASIDAINSVDGQIAEAATVLSVYGMNMRCMSKQAWLDGPLFLPGTPEVT